ncbi:MAG: DNA mismatch repair protein MutS [Treponema sp.]|jgi:DNA mismatch repair protein MutS|nr:DNA mismatch repair protein MutS [Treponema sp.]
MDAPKNIAASPMIEQYRRIKKDHKNNILFFRLGDFYEMFAEDAIEVSSLLNLTLTARNGLPMCGVPHHSARTYISRLLKHGKKIAICEQLSAPGKNKIVERDVVEIITPGTTVDEDYLDNSTSNYLACMYIDNTENNKKISFSYIDISAGDFYSTSFPIQATEMLKQELERLSIKEILVPESVLEDESINTAINDRGGIVINKWSDWLFDSFKAKERLEKQFGVANLKGFGLQEDSIEIISAGILLEYLDTTSKSLLPHIRKINVYKDSEYLGIDESSQRNLELLKNQRDGEVKFSLLEVLDETKTAMGRRLLKRYILHPLRDIKKINNRLDLVESFFNERNTLTFLREKLGNTPDLERLCSRLAMDKAHGRDMLAIKKALSNYHEINKEITIIPLSEISNSGQENTKKIQELLEVSIIEEPSILLSEGNLIKPGYNDELDKLKDLQNNARKILEDYLEEERQITGISNLKIKYNRMIGYYFEVTTTQLTRVPQHFIRRQGVLGAERFSTDRLAALETEINNASARVVDLEKDIFMQIRETAKKELNHLASAARLLSKIDVAQSMAQAASIRNWQRPVLENSGKLEIYDGRHPVVEAHLNRGEYIPNNILLDTENVSFAMITGPNMAGKSTYLRSAALITIMAQAGSFVPAGKAVIGICDRIYCRVGASDNLARGESTFLVEMNETAFILNSATEKSLVIMDEVGRGTATNDGLSIAWAVSEELLNRLGCRTLFATHFHELSLLNHSRLANRSMEVLDKGEKIIFLRKIKEGPAAESYGIHVAKLAGIPDTILKRASEIMARLKERDKDLTTTFHSEKIIQKSESDEPRNTNKVKKTVKNTGENQPDLFD